MRKLIDKINTLNPIYQNIIMGLVTGVLVGLVIRSFFERFGASGIVLFVFVLIGIVLGYLSGRERVRHEKLKIEKSLLEEDIGKMQTAYHQVMNKYRLLFDNISDAIYLTSEDGRFLLFNEATCLLSGYSREELKNINMSQLQIEEESIEDHRRAWLDNGICRYEERWKTRTGDFLYLDVNSKWINLAKNQYILHIARDSQRRIEAAEEKKIADVGWFLEKQTRDLSRTQQVLLRLIANPISNTFGLLGVLMKKYASEGKKINELVTDWEKVKKLMQLLIAKNNRDLKPGETEWNLNEVVRQELHYLELTSADQNILVNTRFAQELPGIISSGNRLSLVFGNLFLAMIRMLEKTSKKQMIVTTRFQDNQSIVEILSPQFDAFEKHLSAVVDPSFSEQEAKGLERGMEVMKKLLDPLRGKIEITFPDDGIAVKVKFGADSDKTKALKQ